jgi:hypothetical protein
MPEEENWCLGTVGRTRQDAIEYLDPNALVAVLLLLELCAVTQHHGSANSCCGFKNRKGIDSWTLLLGKLADEHRAIQA